MVCCDHRSAGVETDVGLRLLLSHLSSGTRAFVADLWKISSGVHPLRVDLLCIYHLSLAGSPGQRTLAPYCRLFDTG